MDTMTMQTVADGFAWLADLVPFLAVPLVLLLAFELAVLLAAIIATDRRRYRPSRLRRPSADRLERRGARLGSRHLTVLALALVASSCGGGDGSGRDPVAPCTGAGCGSGVASVTISPASIAIDVGTTAVFTAAALDANGGTVSGVSFSWSSADDGIVRIDQNGSALGVAEGSTTIRATAEARSATATVTVTRSAAPTANRILFSSNRTGSYEVHSMAADGGDVRRLTYLRESRFGNHPAWSPDGRTVAFLKHVSLAADLGVRQVLYTMDASGGDITEVASGVFDPSWFRDSRGACIAVSDAQRIWSIAPADQSMQTLIHTGAEFGSTDTPDLSAQAWWDAVNLLVFSTTVGRINERYHLFALDPATRIVYEFQASATANGDNRYPAVSSRGEIAFVSTRDGNNEIYALTSQSLVRLTTDPASDHSPVWSPDGSMLAFVSERTGNAEIFVIRRDGTGLRNITNHPAADIEPAWSPH